ncbi:MAG: hypothetical protein IJV27_02880 [Prevotella sp.]|nr:hypothetical protein [Prevotella sp.]
MKYESPETEVVLVKIENLMQIVVSGTTKPEDTQGKEDGFDFDSEVGGNSRPNVWDD